MKLYKKVNRIRKAEMARNWYLFGDIEQILIDIQWEYENAARLEAAAISVVPTKSAVKGSGAGVEIFLTDSFTVRQKNTTPLPLDGAETPDKIIGMGVVHAFCEQHLNRRF